MAWLCHIPECVKRLVMKGIASILVLCLSLLSCSSTKENTAASNVQSPIINGNGFAIVELFTSEGCTSCPMAEALMPKLKDAYGNKVTILEFHVDYWDHNGWKDPYSDKTYSLRQQNYADHFNHSNPTIYTPQAIVNGKSGINGSVEASLKSLINTELQQTPSKEIELNISNPSKDKITVSYSTTLDNKEVLNIALIQLKPSANIKTGENAGKALQHMNVVRALVSETKDNGTINFTLPDDLSPKEFHIVAYTQNATSRYITAVKESEIQKEGFVQRLVK